MGSHCSEDAIPSPKGWTDHVKSALIQSVSLAATALRLGHGQVTRRGTQDRLNAELEGANTEIALLEEKLAIKDAR